MDHKAENIYIWPFTGSLPTPDPEQKNVCGVQAAAMCLPKTSKRNPPPSPDQNRPFPEEPWLLAQHPPTSPREHGLYPLELWETLRPDSFAGPGEE